MHPFAAFLLGAGIAALAKKLLTASVEPNDIVNCAPAMRAYYDERVRLTRAQKRVLADHRDANRNRILDGLARRFAPSPIEFVAQGSYAMNTINQDAENEYDIDDGVVFAAKELVGPRGRRFESLDARKLVLACLDDDTRIKPELRTNCVRIPYAGGYHVDVPVYRRVDLPLGGSRLEHAGPDWQAADPQGVTAWFQAAVEQRSPDSTNGRQLRRVVRLMKKMLANHRSWNIPSGFVLSCLAVESYVGCPDRDDAALYLCLMNVHRRLNGNFVVNHPVVDRRLTRGDSDPRIIALRDGLTDLLRQLEPLVDENTTPHAALTAWRRAFNDPYLTLIREDYTDREDTEE